MNTKQVLIWRSDLRNADGHKVRTGKVAAQLAHASMAAILNQGYFQTSYDLLEPKGGSSKNYVISMTPEMEDWIMGRFTKICVSVNSEEELLSIYKQAEDAGMVCSLIQDAGLTEFDGVPTYTAVAIGPADADEINKITGELKLL